MGDKKLPRREIEKLAHREHRIFKDILELKDDVLTDPAMKWWTLG